MTAALRAAPPPAIARDRDDDGVNILLVDDRAENLLTLDAILEPLGERLVRAHSGDEALKCLLTDEFAVILLDVQMPGLNGFETAELIKSRERTRYVPIIFLTAISKDDAYVFRGYSVGAVDYMSKPFQPDVLRSKVAVFVDLYRKQRQIKKQERMLHEAAVREIELEHRAELLAQEARTSQIVSTALDAIVVLDVDRRIVVFNAAAERMFGRGSADVIGGPVAALIADDELDRALTRVAEVPASNGKPELHAITGVRSNGERFPLEASLSCLDIGGDLSFTIIARDVTERLRSEEALRTQAISLAENATELRQLNDELKARQEELERAMSARNRFYASMSHELRTPINAVLGGVSLLLDTPLSPEQQEYAAIAMHGSEALLALVDDVLTYTALEGGDAAIIPAPIDLRELVAEAVAAMRPEATAKTLDLRLVLDPALPARVTGDALRLRQVLRLLLQNAIKFTEAGGVTLALDLFNGSGGPPTVRFAVLDTGIGIPPERVSAVFDHFAQADGSSTRRHGGLGLGLAIVRRLVTRMGGTIDVASIPDRGSTFWFTVPFIAADAPPGYGATNPS